MFKKINAIYIVTFILCFLVFFLNLQFSNLFSREHFLYLAKSFLDGHLYFLPDYTSQIQIQNFDMVKFGTHYFWPLGPLPAIILTPFIFIFDLFNFSIQSQWPFHFAIFLGVFYLCFKLVKIQGYGHFDSLILAIAFCFSSMFIGVAFIPASWYFAQIVTVFLLFLSLYEYFSKKRLWLIGVIFGCLLLTRVTAALGITFYILDIISSKDEWVKDKIKKLSSLLFPLILSFIILIIYNYARFDNFLEQGYTSQILPLELSTARNYGLINLIHLPGNFYYAFLHGPIPVFRDSISHVLKFPFFKPDPWGMSIFITSPYLLYLFFIEYKDKVSKLLLLSSLVIAIPIFLYYGIGTLQFGYRYALDFMPFIFTVFTLNYFRLHKTLSYKLKLLIFASVLVNVYLFISLFYKV